MSTLGPDPFLDEAAAMDYADALTPFRRTPSRLPRVGWAVVHALDTARHAAEAASDLTRAITSADGLTTADRDTIAARIDKARQHLNAAEQHLEHPDE